MADDIQRDLGRMEADIETIKSAVQDMRADLKAIKEELAEMRGGTKTLLGIAAMLGGAVTAAGQWIVQHLAK